MTFLMHEASYQYVKVRFYYPTFKVHTTYFLQ